jgi:hypothetical protein
LHKTSGLGDASRTAPEVVFQSRDRGNSSVRAMAQPAPQVTGESEGSPRVAAAKRGRAIDFQTCVRKRCGCRWLSDQYRNALSFDTRHRLIVIEMQQMKPPEFARSWTKMGRSHQKQLPRLPEDKG